MRIRPITSGTDGIRIAFAMGLTGHKTESVYRRYAIADRTALEEGVAKLAKVHGKAQPARKVIPIDGTRGS